MVLRKLLGAHMALMNATKVNSARGEALVQHQWWGGVVLRFFWFFLVNFFPIEKTRYRPKTSILEIRLHNYEP